MIENDKLKLNLEHKKIIHTFKPDSIKDYVEDKKEYNKLENNEENLISLVREVELMKSKFI